MQFTGQNRAQTPHPIHISLLTLTFFLLSTFLVLIASTGHFFAGSEESPGYVDTIQGRKVKVYRGIGSKEARTTEYILDRYIESEGAKSLPEGVSDYVPIVGSVSGVLSTLTEGLRNGMIYAGAKNIEEMKKVKVGIVSNAGQVEQRPHDLLGRY